MVFVHIQNQERKATFVCSVRILARLRLCMLAEIKLINHQFLGTVRQRTALAGALDLAAAVVRHVGRAERDAADAAVFAVTAAAAAHLEALAVLVARLAHNAVFGLVLLVNLIRQRCPSGRGNQQQPD